MEGYIALHRKIIENEFYFSERFTKSQAWIDLILLASHTDRILFIRNIEIKLRAGDLCYSQLSLAERWKWDFKTVNKFLKILENRKMVEIKTNNITTIISIKNWQFYQVSRNKNIKECSNYEVQSGEQMESKMETNNNVNKVNNNINNKKLESMKSNEIDRCHEYEKDFDPNLLIVPPKLEWITDRCSKMNYPDCERESERFYNYYESNGWKVGSNPMKNWGSALFNWFKNYETFKKPKNINYVKKPTIKESKSSRINRNLESAGKLLSNIESYK